MGKKFSSLICFELYSVPAALVVQITTIKEGTQTNDPTFQLCENTIIEGVVQCLSIVTACWGQLKPFISWMRSNGLKLSDTDDTSAWAYKMSNRSQTRPKLRTHSRKIRTGKSAGTGGVDSGFSLPLRHDQILVTHDWDVNSQSSRANIIVEARDGENNCHDGRTSESGPPGAAAVIR